LPGPVLGADRKAYHAQVVGAPMRDGRWEGWVEFAPVAGGPPVRSPRETTQPNRTDMVYWASGLSATYMQGALARALKRPVVITPPAAEPFFNAPAGEFVAAQAQPRVPAILDPFSVYEKGESLLRQEPGTLSVRHLINIVGAYQLSAQPPAALDRLAQPALIDLIVSAVRRQR
jgi:hypothetical protein